MQLLLFSSHFGFLIPSLTMLVNVLRSNQPRLYHTMMLANELYRKFAWSVCCVVFVWLVRVVHQRQMRIGDRQTASTMQNREWKKKHHAIIFCIFFYSFLPPIPHILPFFIYINIFLLHEVPLFLQRAFPLFFSFACSLAGMLAFLPCSLCLRSSFHFNSLFTIFHYHDKYN